MATQGRGREAAQDLIQSVRHLEIAPNGIDRIRLLGAGGHGDVWLGEIRNSGPATRRVAVKEMRPKGTDRRPDALNYTFLRELYVWTKLDSPFILALQGFSMDEGAPLFRLISPYMENGEIYSYLLNRQPPPNMVLRLRLLWEVTQGLAYLHANGIVHGDMKGGNILVDDDEHAKICDFGVAKLLSTVTNLTTSSEPLTTLRYQAPEDLQSQTLNLAYSRDIWTLGCVAIEILAQRLPFHGINSPVNIMFCITQGTLPADVASLQIPDPMKSLIRACWNGNADRRPLVGACQNDVHIEYLRYYSRQSLDDLEVSEVLCRQSHALRVRFERSCSAEDLKEAIDCATRSLELNPENATLWEDLETLRVLKPTRDTFLPSNSGTSEQEASSSQQTAASYHAKGVSLYSQYKRTQKRSDLDEAIHNFSEALRLRSPPHSERALTLQELATARYRRFIISNRSTPEDLELVINYYHELLVLQPRRSVVRRELAVAYHARFLHKDSRQPGDLDQAIEHYRQALALNDSRRTFICHELGCALHTRFQQKRVRADLTEAIQLLTQARDQGHAGAAKNLSDALASSRR